MSNLHAHIGITKTAKFDSAPTFVKSLSTAHLKPCVALVMFNQAVNMGAVSHLRVRHRTTIEDVYDSVRNFRNEGFDPSTTRVALVGGNDFDMPEERGIQTSTRMVSVLNSVLDNFGFSVDYEDLYGSHARRILLDKTGKLNVDDDWKEDASKYPYAVELEKTP